MEMKIYQYLCIDMRFERIIRILKYILLCLAFIAIDKADDSAISHTANASYDFSAENYSFSTPEPQCRLPRQTNFSNLLRASGQSVRSNHTNNCRNGFVLAKSGKSMNPYTTSLFFVSLIRFPSGLTEANHRLISLGKLII